MRWSNHVGRGSMLGFAASLGLVSASSGALMIDHDDVAGGQYVYELTYANMATTTKFDNDVLSRTTLTRSTGSDRYIGNSSGTTGFEFVYLFDFSSLNLDVEAVTFRDRFFSSTNNTVSILTSEWSVDGVNYTELHTMNRTSSSDSTLSLEVNAVDFTTLGSLPDKVYYRVTLTRKDGGTYTGSGASRWNRLEAADAAENRHFRAEFTVVPEPASALLAGLAAFPLLWRRR